MSQEAFSLICIYAEIHIYLMAYQCISPFQSHISDVLNDDCTMWDMEEMDVGPATAFQSSLISVAMQRSRDRVAHWTEILFTLESK